MLLIIRHAKSSWGDASLKDFDRPLNIRGHRDAPEMAARLLDKKIHIDAFVSSTAIRALTTAAYFAKAYGRKEKDIIKVPELYHAAIPVFYSTIASFDNAFASVALFSHNPGITAFVNGLSDARIDDMPTCAVFAVTADINNWKDFADAERSFFFFDYPRL